VVPCFAQCLSPKPPLLEVGLYQPPCGNNELEGRVWRNCSWCSGIIKKRKNFKIQKKLQGTGAKKLPIMQIFSFFVKGDDLNFRRHYALLLI
jgi:hypothetical protein